MTTSNSTDAIQDASDQKHFVMCCFANREKYIGIMCNSHLMYWKGFPGGLENGLNKLKLSDPKIYVEAQSRENPQQVLPLFIPPHHPATKQKVIWLAPDSIIALEDLGAVNEAEDECLDSSEFYLMYKDAVNAWNAHMANVLAPTAMDIGRVMGGKDLNGKIRLR